MGAGEQRGAVVRTEWLSPVPNVRSVIPSVRLLGLDGSGGRGKGCEGWLAFTWVLVMLLWVMSGLRQNRATVFGAEGLLRWWGVSAGQ